MNDISQNFSDIRAKINASAMTCGRFPSDITLLAVTKTFPIETISRAIDAGHRQFGENRVQEAEIKIPAFKNMAGIEWHLIGHLQSNKTHKAAQLFDVIHSIDSVKIALRLNQSCLELGKQISILLQVDLGKEATKSGADPSEIVSILDAVLPLQGVKVNGLMTIPPFFEDAESARPYFSALRQLRDRLQLEQPGCLGIGHLSMGMSHDFDVAIQEGATIVRIGTALFGAR